MNTTNLIEQLDKQVKGFSRRLVEANIKTIHEKSFTPLYDTWFEILKDYEAIIVQSGKEKLSLPLFKAIRLIRMRIAKVRITVEKIRKLQTVIYYNPKIPQGEDIDKLTTPIRRGLEAMEEKLQTIEDSRDINELLKEHGLSNQPKGD